MKSLKGRHSVAFVFLASRFKQFLKKIRWRICAAKQLSLFAIDEQLIEICEAREDGCSERALAGNLKVVLSHSYYCRLLR